MIIPSVKLKTTVDEFKKDLFDLCWNENKKDFYEEKDYLWKWIKEYDDFIDRDFKIVKELIEEGKKEEAEREYNNCLASLQNALVMSA